MTPNAFSSGSKLVLLLLMLLTSTLSVAQRKSKSLPSAYQNFLDTQWWLGLRFGTNYSDPRVMERNQVFSPVDYSPENLFKTYDRFQQPGGQAGLDFSLYYKGFYIGLQPTFKIMRYRYVSLYEWTGAGDADGLETELEVNHTLQVIEVPFIVKYDLLNFGKIRPFVLAGLQYSMLIDAQKKAKVTDTDFFGGTAQEVDRGTFNIGAKPAFDNFYGAVGGAGVSFDYGNIRSVLEFTYLYSLSDISANANPYLENELVALGDANDQLRLNQINIALSFVFPLRFLDRTFQPY